MSRTDGRFTPRVYRTQTTVIRNRVGQPVGVESIPYPIHRAKVRFNDGLWIVTFPTIKGAERVLSDNMEKALTAAGRIVGLAAGSVLQTFTPAQRYAMGQQQCPYAGKGATRVCGLAPEVGSVWCEHHKGGKENG